jgi:hypothetical protein
MHEAFAQIEKGAIDRVLSAPQVRKVMTIGGLEGTPT